MLHIQGFSDSKTWNLSIYLVVWLDYDPEYRALSFV
jgi:hypothetical protein